MTKINTKSTKLPGPYRPLRLSTLVRIRWLALSGQLASVLYVAFALKFPLPLIECLSLIVASSIFNLVLVIRFGVSHRPTNTLAAAQLAFDSLQLAGLLWLTGGLANPFAILLLAPVSVSATILPQRETVLVATLVGALATLLAVLHLTLPWDPDTPLELQSLYLVGTWVALLCGIVFVAAYSGRVAHEARQLADALTATELALSRQQQLSALDGMAAATAHALGTPLSTIALAAKELLLDVEEGPIKRDVELIIEQSTRCRNILATLRNLDDEGKNPFAAVPLSELIAELAQPFEHFDKPINIRTLGIGRLEPVVVRNVGLLYGLGNLIENAARFARSEVTIEASWNEEIISITITDDGPGIAPELLSRLGEPYLTTSDRRQTGGLGLGVFIAKTLLDRTDAAISFANTHTQGHAQVALRWARPALEVDYDLSAL